MIVYTLADPIPSVVTRSSVNQAVTGLVSSHCMWEDGDNHIHLLAPFYNNYWYGLHIDLTAKTSHMLSSPETGAPQGLAYRSANNKLYIGNYYGAALLELDPTNGNISTIADSGDVGPCKSVSIGDDGLVYYVDYANPNNNTNVWSYNPANQAWKSYGGVGNNAGYSIIGIDTSYVYLILVNNDGNTWQLYSSPIAGSPTWTAWDVSGNGTDIYLNIKKDNSSPQKWFVSRKKADNSWVYYYVEDNVFTETTPAPTEGSIIGPPLNCLVTNDEQILTLCSSWYSYDLDYKDFMPLKGFHEYTRIYYRITGTEPWDDYEEGSYTGPWVAKQVTNVLPIAGSGTNNFCSGIGYTAFLDVDYASQNYNPLGTNPQSTYVIKKHPVSGEYYMGGYSNLVYRFNPTTNPANWTMNNSNCAPYSPIVYPPWDDEDCPNPYALSLPVPLLHYRHGIDFDSNGLVWIGGNTTRLTPSQGNVLYYDPSDGSMDYIFTDWLITLTGLTITVNATNKTFTRPTGSGSWIDDGVLVSHGFQCAGFSNSGNNSGYVVDTVTDLVVTLTSGTGLVDETSGAGAITTYLSKMFRSICSSNNLSKILVSDNTGRIYVISAGNPPSLDATPIIPVANTATLSYMVEVSNDLIFGIVITPTSYKVMKLVPSTKTITYLEDGPAGTPFGFANNEGSRMSRRLELGPDGYVWMFVDNTMYRVNPVDCSFNSVLSGTYAKVNFAANNTDLMIYYEGGNGTDFKYIPGILEASGGYSKGSYASLPSDDANLTTLYSGTDMTNVATDDEIRVSESGNGYVLHAFKEFASPYATKMEILCELQVALAPSAYTVYLQIYDRVTLGGMWVTVDSDTTSGANVDFSLSFTLDSGSTPTFANCKDTETREIASRVWQSNIPPA